MSAVGVSQGHRHRDERGDREAIEIRKRGNTTMNRDEVQYHLFHIMMNCCSMEICRTENHLVTPRHPLKNQRSSRRAQCHPVLIKETGASKTSTTLK